MSRMEVDRSISPEDAHELAVMKNSFAVAMS
jgi:hypothetical protein